MRRLLSLLKPVPLVALIAWVTRSASAGTPGSDLAEELARALEQDRGLAVDVASVGWIDPPSGGIGARWRRPRALFLGRRGPEPADVWIARAALSPEGRLLRVVSAHDVTNTSAVGESQLVVSGQRAAWTVGSGSTTYRVELADFAGQEAPLDWPLVSRLQHAITNWQKTGGVGGILRRSFRLDPAASRVALRLDANALSIQADGHAIVVAFDRARRIEGQRYVSEQDRELAMPGNLVTWAVDRARDSEWLGDERMQLIKAVAFRGLDVVDRFIGRVRRDDSAERIADELGSVAATADPVYPDPETGWPPEPMRPFFSDPIAGEGRWIALDADPFVPKNPNLPSPVVTTFVRTDEDRVYSRIFVALWDPRQVDLHMVPGTEEPQSATGEIGTGMIPREPKTLTRLVAAFNGGFQSTHGDYGMMVEERLLVPPRPYAATVAVLDDGTTGFGTWPADLSIDPNLSSFRQNLTPLVVDGELNPYGRDWWGGVPQDWEDETRTVRSGLCLTREGFLAYFYGSTVDHEHLGMAMQSARCSYGLHLDMNQGHTGLEFYRVGRASELPPIGKKVESVWQAEGDVRGAAGYRFRGRRLIRNMQLMHFPRYIRRGQRDYFYLTLRHLIPGAPLSSAPGGDAEDGQWRVDGLPQYGWPFAIATTQIRPDPARPETKIRIAKLDPKFLRTAHSSDGMAPIAAFVPAESESGPSLWSFERRFAIAEAPPAPNAIRVVTGESRQNARAALSICTDGMTLYAEVSTALDPARDHALLAAVLDRLDCREGRLFFQSANRFAIGADRDLSGHPVTVPDGAPRLVRRDQPETARIFKETPILPRAKWMDLQRQQRFFPREDAGSPTDGLSTAPPEFPTQRN